MAAQEAVFAQISNAIGVQKLYLRVAPVVGTTKVFNLWGWRASPFRRKVVMSVSRTLVAITRAKMCSVSVRYNNVLLLLVVD